MKCTAIVMVFTNIGDEDGVLCMCYSVDQRLQTGGVWFTILYFYICTYRYNTILVNKVEGFHTADRGTELKILFPHPQTCLKNSSFCFFPSSKFPSCSHCISILIGIIKVLCTYLLQACIPQQTKACMENVKWHLEIKADKMVKSRMLMMMGLNIQSRWRNILTPPLFLKAHKPHVDRKLNVF